MFNRLLTKHFEVNVFLIIWNSRILWSLIIWDLEIIKQSIFKNSFRSIIILMFSFWIEYFLEIHLSCAIKISFRFEWFYENLFLLTFCFRVFFSIIALFVFIIIQTFIINRFLNNLATFYCSWIFSKFLVIKRLLFYGLYLRRVTSGSDQFSFFALYLWTK